MDSNDATILALSLGIPSATLLSIAFLLVLRIEYRQLQAWRIPNPTVPTNSPAPPSHIDPYYGIPLEQRPPESSHPYHGDRSHSMSSTEPRGSEENGNSESTHSAIPPPRPPTPPRRRMPVIVISPHRHYRGSPIRPSISLTQRVRPLPRQRKGIRCGP